MRRKNIDAIHRILVEGRRKERERKVDAFLRSGSGETA
jgi:hypothetical protein